MADLLERSTIEWFEVHLPVRGYAIGLRQIKEAYVELKLLNDREADRILAGLTRPEGKTEEQFRADIAQLRKNAFKLTVSIIGGDDNITKYGEDELIFENNELPVPIKTIFFTNENAYKNNANGQSPPNLFRLLLDFAKPPLFDTSPLLSEPTLNASSAAIKANDLTYFRAAHAIMVNKLKRNRLWYSFIHQKFSYDIGLWVLFAPYTLYTVTYYTDKFLPQNGLHSSFRPAAFIYGIGMGLISYRFLMGYLKLALPVNVLKENSDLAAKHRFVFGVIVIGLLTNVISHFFGF